MHLRSHTTRDSYISREANWRANSAARFAFSPRSLLHGVCSTERPGTRKQRQISLCGDPALTMPHQCPGKNAPGGPQEMDMDPSHGVCRALFTVLDQLAKQAGHPNYFRKWCNRQAVTLSPNHPTASCEHDASQSQTQCGRQSLRLCLPHLQKQHCPTKFLSFYCCGCELQLQASARTWKSIGLVGCCPP